MPWVWKKLQNLTGAGPPLLAEPKTQSGLWNTRPKTKEGATALNPQCDCKEAALGMMIFGLLYGVAIPVGLYALWWTSRYGGTWPLLFTNLRKMLRGDSPHSSRK